METIFVEVDEITMEVLSQCTQPNHSTKVAVLAPNRGILLERGCIGTKWGVIAAEIKTVHWQLDKPKGHAAHVNTNLMGDIVSSHGSLFGVGAYYLDVEEKTIAELVARLPNFKKKSVWTFRDTRKFLSDWELTPCT